MTGNLANMIAQGEAADYLLRKLSICCARCVRPIRSEERLKVGPYTYGECCMLDVQTQSTRAK